MSSRPVRRAALLSTLAMLACGGPIAQAASAAGTPGGGGTPAPTATDPTTPTAPVQVPTPAPAPSAVSETQTVKLTRSQVKSVQRRAGVRADGALGSRTRSAIKGYQAKKRLVRTGRPNLQTLKAMKLAFAKKVEQELVARQRTAVPPASAVAGYVFPIQGPWSFGGSATAFGDRGGAHEGVDLLSACGTPVVAASSGTVKANTDQSAAGNYLVITDTPSGEDQAYMHLRSPSPLQPGTRVEAGSTIAAVGDTGNATACLLHFELWGAPGWQEGKPRDPREDLESWGGSPTAAAR
jgi:murein DD-endopeptidase MepM/ murein hydrolase activator NlpD